MLAAGQEPRLSASSGVVSGLFGAGSQRLRGRPCRDRKLNRMPIPTRTPKQLREYLQDLELRLAVCLDALGARLEVCEKALAAIERRLVSKSRSGPGITGRLGSDEEGG